MKVRSQNEVIELLRKYGMDKDGDFVINETVFNYEPLWIRKGGYIPYKDNETLEQYRIYYCYGKKRGCYISVTVQPEYNRYTVNSDIRKYSGTTKEEKETFLKNKDWLIGLMTSICLDATK